MECSGGLPPSDCKGDISTLGQRWKKYKRPAEYYNAAKAITAAERKKAVLLLIGGPDLQDLFCKLTIAEPTGHETVYTKAIEALDRHFLPKINATYEKHIFHEMFREENESFDQFVSL